jgi:hypothetical protein
MQNDLGLPIFPARAGGGGGGCGGAASGNGANHYANVASNIGNAKKKPASPPSAQNQRDYENYR